jgi:hypothetical protein
MQSLLELLVVMIPINLYFALITFICLCDFGRGMSFGALLVLSRIVEGFGTLEL